ncbi:hypothetical protein, partial [Clostridium gasigenes]
MSIRDVDLANFSNLSYLNIQLDIKDRFDKSGELSMKEFADYYLSDEVMKKEFDLSDINDQAKIAAL